MSDIDGLLQMCLASPADSARRFILCDALAEAGETELETELRGENGEAIIRRVYALADSLKRSACLRLLWSVAVIESSSLAWAVESVPKLTAELNAAIGSARRGKVVVLPGGGERVSVGFPPKMLEELAKPRLADLKWTTPTPPVGPT